VPVIPEHLTPPGHHSSLPSLLLEATNDPAQVLPLLDLGAKELDIRRQVIGVNAQVVYLLLVDDQAAGLAADLLDQLAVDKVTVAGEPGVILTDQGANLAPFDPMKQRLQHRPVMKFLS
jgi:hypothetical protein